MKNKPQIFYIHGGETFRSKKDYLHFLKTRKVTIGENLKWHGDFLSKELGHKFEITRPRMPMADNARYDEWKIHFDRYLPLIRANVILIGGSLGGIFLAKYLSENKFPKKILATYLVCAPFDDSLREDLAGGFKLKSSLSLLEKNSPNLTLLFSKDDDVVPVSHAEKYREKLKNARIVIYKSKNGHFKVSKFPEIIKMIKNDIKKK